jgi:hypothetical protein
MALLSLFGILSSVLYVFNNNSYRLYPYPDDFLKSTVVFSSDFHLKSIFNDSHLLSTSNLNASLNSSYTYGNIFRDNVYMKQLRILYSSSVDYFPNKLSFHDFCSNLQNSFIKNPSFQNRFYLSLFDKTESLKYRSSSFPNFESEYLITRFVQRHEIYSDKHIFSIGFAVVFWIIFVVLLVLVPIFGYCTWRRAMSLWAVGEDFVIPTFGKVLVKKIHVHRITTLKNADLDFDSKVLTIDQPIPLVPVPHLRRLSSPGDGF